MNLHNNEVGRKVSDQKMGFVTSVGKLNSSGWPQLLLAVSAIMW